LYSAHFILSKRETKTNIHIAKIPQAKGEDLKEYVMRFNREAVLILDLQNGVSCTAFLNGFLSGKFKFSFVESKITALADVLRRDQDFIQVIEISD